MTTSHDPRNKINFLSKFPTQLLPKLFSKIPLRVLLIVPFVVQTVGAVTIVGYLSFRNGQKAVNDVAIQLRNETGDRIEQNLTYLVTSPFQAFKSYEFLLDQNRINLSAGTDLEKFFYRQLSIFPNLSNTGFATANQEFFGAERQDNGQIVIRTSEVENNFVLNTYTTNVDGDRQEIVNASKPNFDPRKRSYYKIPIEQNRAFWGKVFPHVTGKTMYIAPGQPIYNRAGKLQGVWMASLNLAMFGDFLSKIKIGKTGQSFILERSGEMIATSTGEKPFQYYPDKVVTLPEQKVERLKVTNSTNVVTQKTSQFLLDKFQDFQNIQTPQQLEFSMEDKRYFVQVSPFRDDKGLDWLMVIAIPESDFMAQINANNQSTIAFSLIALCISLGIGIFTGHWITQPILRLNQASKAIASRELNQTVIESPVRELQELTKSFNYMAQQLQELFNTLEHRVEDRTAELQGAKEEVEEALQELQTTQAQLIQSEKMSSLGQLVAGVAHEINNPVSFISGNLRHADESIQALLKLIQTYQAYYPQPPQEIVDQAEEIDIDFLISDLPNLITSMKEGAKRIQGIVLALRNFSRLDETGRKLIDIHDGIDSTLLVLGSRFKPTVDRIGIEVLRNYGDLPAIDCYPGQLNQVFMNILANAIDSFESHSVNDALENAIEEGKQFIPTINIQTILVDNTWAEIHISDNGEGISDAIKQQIFNPFFTTKPVGKGTGMGLAISYQIITNQHNGTLECSSQLGVGTEFVIRIPYSKCHSS